MWSCRSRPSLLLQHSRDRQSRVSAHACRLRHPVLRLLCRHRWLQPVRAAVVPGAGPAGGGHRHPGVFAKLDATVRALCLGGAGRPQWAARADHPLGGAGELCRRPWLLAADLLHRPGRRDLPDVRLQRRHRAVERDDHRRAADHPGGRHGRAPLRPRAHVGLHRLSRQRAGHGLVVPAARHAGLCVDDDGLAGRDRRLCLAHSGAAGHAAACPHGWPAGGRGAASP